MKILVCYDGSREANAALDEAVRYAARLGGSVTVVTSARSEGPEAERARSWLAAAEEHLEGADVAWEAHCSVRDLYPGEDLTLLAEERGADLVVVGVKNRSKLGKLLLGSVTQHVMLAAPCPVLGVK